MEEQMTEQNLNHNDKNSEELSKREINREKEENPKKKPMRFIFGHDTTEEDVERFLDSILGPDPKKNVEDKNEISNNENELLDK
jgi:threonine aldolase